MQFISDALIMSLYVERCRRIVGWRFNCLFSRGWRLLWNRSNDKWWFHLSSRSSRRGNWLLRSRYANDPAWSSIPQDAKPPDAKCGSQGGGRSTATFVDPNETNCFEMDWPHQWWWSFLLWCLNWFEKVKLMKAGPQVKQPCFVWCLCPHYTAPKYKIKGEMTDRQ